jgi:hypothetical protein
VIIGKPKSIDYDLTRLFGDPLHQFLTEPSLTRRSINLLSHCLLMWSVNREASLTEHLVYHSAKTRIRKSLVLQIATHGRFAGCDWPTHADHHTIS